MEMIAVIFAVIALTVAQDEHFMTNQSDIVLTSTKGIWVLFL